MPLKRVLFQGSPRSETVFPIAIAGAASQVEWERLKRQRYSNRDDGDLDFLGDQTAEPNALAARVAEECKRLLELPQESYSRRVFIVHGREAGLKNRLARLLERLDFIPIILNEQPDQGRTILEKLRAELRDVGYAFILLTPDDVGGLSGEAATRARARQNVVFEFGLLLGVLGPSRVCAVVADDVEMPSDLQGIVYKRILPGADVSSIALELIGELRKAGYDVDANRL